MRLRTLVGEVGLEVWHGQDPGDGHWGCPVREVWGLRGHQEMSPGLAERLVFTVTATGTYEEASAVARQWGCVVDDSTLHVLVQRVGREAEEQTRQRLATVAEEVVPGRPGAELAVLMLDGWQVRQRGPGWGVKRTQAKRVEWHELKTGVFYRHEQAGHTAGGRGLLAEKVVVSWQGEPVDFGARLHWEARRGGLGRARAVEVLGDGAPWIWNVAADRWKGASQLLDFYHGSEHLWAVGHALHGEGEAARAWVEPRLHRLRHGREKSVLKELSGLSGPAGEAGKVIEREKNYFAGHAQRMNYQTLADRGWPIGSGAVESACRQRQCRFKRPGQFWTENGLRHLCAVDEARRNGHWDALWTTR